MGKLPKETKIAYFKHIAGDEALVEINAFEYEDGEDLKLLETLLNKLDTLFASDVNETRERFTFDECKQMPNENVDKFVINLRTLF